MPSLQRAAPRPAAAVAKPAEADELAAPVPDFLSHKEIILRLVETLKAL